MVINESPSASKRGSIREGESTATAIRSKSKDTDSRMVSFLTSVLISNIEKSFRL